MDMGVAGVPAALGQVGPAPQLERFIHRLVADHYLLSEWEILLTALDGDGVSSRRQVDDEWMSRKSGVHLNGFRQIVALFAVSKRRAVRRLGLREEALAAFRLNVNPASKRPATVGIEDGTAQAHRLPALLREIRGRGETEKQYGSQ